MSQTAAVRWRKDTGWEFRCPDCAESNQGQNFWPLTSEFWDHYKGMVRCKACWYIHERRRMAELYRLRPQHERRREWQRIYYRKNRAHIREVKRRAYARRQAAKLAEAA